jgi:uncharacterized protein with PhoU and TrkA domain
VRVRPDSRSRSARSPTSSSRSRSACGSWRSGAGKEWLIDPDGDDVLVADDVLILAGSPTASTSCRVLAGAPDWRPPTVEEDPDDHRPRPRVDVLVEMKNFSEVRVGLAYSALLFNDQSLAAECRPARGPLDEMRERPRGVGAAQRGRRGRPVAVARSAPPRRAAEEIGDARSRWCGSSKRARRLHPIVAVALGDADEVITRVPVADGAPLDGVTLKEAQLETETGFYLLAIRRAGRYLYRPRGNVQIVAGDELIGSGPDEGQPLLAQLCGVPDPRGRRHRRGSSSCRLRRAVARRTRP